MISRRIAHISAVADRSIKKEKVSKVFAFVKRFYARVRDDDVSALGAQFAYHLIMSLFPFLLFLAALATYAPIPTEGTLNELSAVVPREALKVVRGTLYEIARTNRSNILSLSMLVTIYLASNGFAVLARGLNKAYDVAETRGFVKLRALSLLFVPLVSLGILLEAVAVVFGKLFLCRLSVSFCWSAGGIALMQALRLILPFLMMTLIFALLYTMIPNRKLRFRQSFLGAAFASAAWALASLGFSFYVNRFADYTRLYGSLGGVMILLVWLYLTSVVVLIGCEINAALYFSRKKGSGSRP